MPTPGLLNQEPWIRMTVSKKKNVHVPLFPTASRLNTSIFPWIADMEPGDLLLETVTEKTEKKKKRDPWLNFSLSISKLVFANSGKKKREGKAFH